MREAVAPPWALILAGGDGTRLRPLTTQIVGDARPKQFCPLVDGETLLDGTRRRLDLVVEFERQMIVVTSTHEAYYRGLRADLPPGRLVIQPRDRGTAPAIVASILQLVDLAGHVPVVVMPSDHYISDDAVFMHHVAVALETVLARPDVVVLLGVEPTHPETEYGWIAPADSPLAHAGDPVFPISRFWEKPGAGLAEKLFQADCVWNSFVMVGWTQSFIDLVAATSPVLATAFAPHRPLRSARGPQTLEPVYRRLPKLDFSAAVLVPGVERLAVLRVKGVEWSDWGHPRRVLASLGRAGLHPAWLDRVHLAEAG